MTDETARLRDRRELIDALQQQFQPALPEELQSWLGRLALLYGVPFENVVPDARMLPPESIRFFYVDSNWLEALIDGAFSVGVHSDRDIRYHAVMQHVIRKATDLAAGRLRRDLRGDDGDAEKTAGLLLDERVRGGFLMRSAIVSGWPGLEVTGYSTPDEAELDENILPLLRMERLTPDVLLCLFSDIPARVVIKEPAEDFHFGLTGDSVQLRNPATGERLEKLEDPEDKTRLDSVGVPWRDEVKRVIDVEKLYDAVDGRLNDRRVRQVIEDAVDLETADQDVLDVIEDPLGSATANFAVQMIDVADKQVFVPPLFTLAVALASELDKAILPAELITAIRQHDEALDTEEASVNVIVLGSRWAIKAGGRAYVIRRAKRSLLVFHHPDGASEEESG